MTVSWYGGGKRRVGTVSRAGHWYKGGDGLVPLRWVFVRDLTGTHRDEYFFTTDMMLGAGADHRALRVALEHRNHFPRAACPPGAGDDTRVAREDGAAGGPVPDRAVLGGRRAVRAAARGEACRWRELGAGRRAWVSRMRCAPFAAGCGRKPFCHRPVPSASSRNCPNPCANCCLPHLLPQLESRRIGSSRAKRP